MRKTISYTFGLCALLMLTACDDGKKSDIPSERQQSADDSNKEVQAPVEEKTQETKSEESENKSEETTNDPIENSPKPETVDNSTNTAVQDEVKMGADDAIQDPANEQTLISENETDVTTDTSVIKPEENNPVRQDITAKSLPMEGQTTPEVIAEDQVMQPKTEMLPSADQSTVEGNSVITEQVPESAESGNEAPAAPVEDLAPVSETAAATDEMSTNQES